LGKEASSDEGEQSDEEEVKAGDNEEGKSQEWEKKRKRRTREDIEKEVLLMGDLYAILGIEHLIYEANDKEVK
jgi:hypothetical protein